MNGMAFHMIFDLRLKLFALMSGGFLVDNVLADVFDMAGKAGTLPMQALMLVCIITLGAVIVWQNKGRESLNKERHIENQQIQQELLAKLTIQQATIDAERIARIGKLMDQQKEDIEAKKELSFSLRELSGMVQKSTEVSSELERAVNKLTDHLELRKV